MKHDLIFGPLPGYTIVAGNAPYVFILAELSPAVIRDVSFYRKGTVSTIHNLGKLHLTPVAVLISRPLVNNTLFADLNFHIDTPVFKIRLIGVIISCKSEFVKGTKKG